MAELLQGTIESAEDLPEGFKMTRLGPLPENWKVVKLGEIVQKTSQIDPRKKPDWQFGYVDVSSVSSQKLRIDGYTVYQGAKAPSRARKLVNAGDVIFATVRPSLKRVALVPAELDGHICSTAFCVIRPEPHIADNVYVFFAVCDGDFVDRVSAHQRGSSYPAVTDSDVLEEFISLPPLSEQRTIAYVLRAVQEAKEAAERVIEATRELKKSLMQYLFTYGPVPIEAADRVPMKETDIGFLPEHWEVVKLGEITRLTRSTLDPRSFSDELFDYYSIPAYQTLGYAVIEKGSAIRSSKTIVESGTILFGKLNPRVPKVWRVVPSEKRKIASTEFIPMHPIYEKCTSDFLYYLCWSDYVLPRSQELVSGSTPSRQRVDINAFLSIKVPVPPLCEQHKITYILKLVDKKLRTEESRKQALEVLFKTLLHNLMTGKVRVTDLALAGTGEVV